jgi:hypothetical protein
MRQYVTIKSSSDVTISSFDATTGRSWGIQHNGSWLTHIVHHTAVNNINMTHSRNNFATTHWTFCMSTQLTS